MDAAPGRLRAEQRRDVRVDEPGSFAEQPVGDLAIPSQYDWRGGDRLSGDGGAGSILSADASVRGVRPNFRATRGDRGVDRIALNGVSDGRRTGAKHCALSAGHAGGDGRSL